MRKLYTAFAIVLPVLLIAGVLSGCTKTEVKKEKVIGFSQGWSGITWLRIMREEVLEEGKKQGMTVHVSDGDNKGEKQLADIEDFINSKVDVLIISTYQAQAIASGVQRALKAGIPVIVISSDIPGAVPTVHLGSDSVVTGRMAGEYLKKVLNGKGKIIEIEGQPGSVVNTGRRVGFEEVLKDNPGLKRVAYLTGYYDKTKAVTVMEDQIQVTPDIQAVYAHNDEMAQGAILVLRKRGYKFYPQDPKGVIVIGCDGLEQPVLQSIKAGEQSASLRYLPLGHEAVQTAVAILAGKPVEKDILKPTPLITRENVDEYLAK